MFFKKEIISGYYVYGKKMKTWRNLIVKLFKLLQDCKEILWPSWSPGFT